MMDELINRVSQKTGLSPDQAKGAIDSVMGFLKEKLPASASSSLDTLLSGAESLSQSGGERLASKATAALGHLFHKDS